MRQVSLGRTLVVGTAVAAAVLLANIVVSFASDSTALWRWLAIPAAGTLAAILSAIKQARQPDTSAATSVPSVAVLQFEKPRRWPKLTSALGRQTLTTAVVVAVVMVGGGAAVVATAARYGMDWVTGNEHGTNRLVRPAESTTSGITISVTKLEQTSHFTRVTVSITNDTGIAISLPVGDGNALIVAGDGTTRRAEAFKSDWTEAIGTGTNHGGVITFNGHLPRDAIRARLIFTRVFGYGDGVPDTLEVSGIQLTSPAG